MAPYPSRPSSLMPPSAQAASPHPWSHAQRSNGTVAGRPGNLAGVAFDAMLFDAGGVLVVPDPEVLGPIVAGFGGADDDATLVRAHFVGAHALDAASGDREAWDEYLRGYARASGVASGAVDDAADALGAVLTDAHWRYPMPGAVDALRALHERGVPIGVVSNAAGQIEQTLVERAICQVDDGAAVPVRCVVDSLVVGVRKPDPAIFTHALPLLGLEPSPAVAYVGDTIFNDVRAAEAAGLTPLLHDPYALHAEGPHQTITALADLSDLIN